MNEAQFRRCIENRRRFNPDRILERPSDGRFLRTAAGVTRRRERVERALSGLVESDWLEKITVGGVTDGSLTLVISDPVVREKVRRALPNLAKQLQGAIPGLRRVHLIDSDAGPEAGADGDSSTGPRERS